MFKQHIITKELLSKAETWSDFKRNKFTHSDNEEDQIGGALGEILFANRYPDAKRLSNTDRQTDFLLKDKRVDVKTTIHKYPPRADYFVHVNEHQKDFLTDFYYFFWYDCENKIIYNLGFVSKNDFYNSATFYEKGDYFPNSNKKMKESIYRLSINNLVR